MATTGEILVEMKYIKEILEKGLDENREDHQQIIKRQDVTNGSLIRHEDRLCFLEKSKEAVRSWTQWIPQLIVASAAVVGIILHFI